MKAQLDIIQNTFVLIIVFLLLAAAFIMYAWMSSVGMQSKLQGYNELEQNKDVNIFRSLPELHCTQSGVVISNCMDVNKIVLFRQSSDSLRYQSQFGFAVIFLQTYNPNAGVWNTLMLYNNTPEDTQSASTSTAPVTLYNASSKKQYLGRISMVQYI